MYRETRLADLRQREAEWVVTETHLERCDFHFLLSIYMPHVSLYCMYNETRLADLRQRAAERVATETHLERSYFHFLLSIYMPQEREEIRQEELKLW